MSIVSAIKPKRPRIIAIDLARIIIVAGVIATHIAATGPLYNSNTSGVIWMLSHVSRNLFILLSILVLIYRYGGEKLNLKTFYIKRFSVIAIPYAVWTLIYQLRYHHDIVSLSQMLSTYVYNLLNATAMYHLYFLLITMQLYLFFPLIQLVYKKIKKYPTIYFGSSLVVQLIFTALMQYGPSIKGLDWWLNAPDNYLFSYQFYLVLGMIIVSRLAWFESFVLTYTKKINIVAIGVAVVGLFIYCFQLHANISPDTASAVFQPYIVVESLVFGLALFSLSYRWVKSGSPHRALVSLVAEDSFGIYLAHVFVISYLANLQPNANDWVTASISIVLGVPVVYGITFALSELIRRTRLSLLLTGRHQNRNQIDWSWFKSRKRAYVAAEIRSD